MAAAEHDRAGAVEDGEEFDDVERRRAREQRQADQQQRECGERRRCQRAWHAQPQGRMASRRACPHHRPSGKARAHHGRQLRLRPRHDQQQARNHDRDGASCRIRAQRPGHPPDRVRDDRHGKHLESRDPARTEGASFDHPQGEDRHQHRRRQREPEPRHQRSRQAGAQVAQSDPDLAACRARQQLAQRHQLRVGILPEPATARDEFVPKVREVSDRTAERRQAEPQEDSEHFAPGAPRGGKHAAGGWRFGIRHGGRCWHASAAPANGATPLGPWRGDRSVTCEA